MQMAKRIFLFLATNILVMISISIILRVLGVGNYITAYGLDYGNLAAFCLVWGMVGSLFSLAISRIMAKMAMGVQVIDPNTARGGEAELVQMVHNLAKAAGLPKMPEVGVYESPELNAFATGPTKSRSLVAVSSGLLQRMDREELEGVLGHEIAHIANGDMVTMTLIQGVVNAFAMFLARVLAFAINQALRSNSDREEGSSASGGLMYFGIQMMLEIVFMILGSIVVAWFSRLREYRADQGGARLAGRDSMIRALDKLRRTYEIVDTGHSGKTVDVLKISGHGRFMKIFSTHPPLEERIMRLQKGVA